MTHKERLFCALERGVPDQVPITWELETRYADTITGTTGWRSICDAHRMIGSSIFNVQGIGPRVHTAALPGYSTDSSTEATPGGGTRHRRSITTPKKTLTAADVVGHAAEDPSVLKHEEYLIKSRDDYEVYADYIAKLARTAEPDVAESQLAYDTIGDDGLVGHWMADSIYHLGHLRPDAEYILDLMEAPDLMEEALRQVDLWSDALLRAFNESVAEVLIYDICWASLSLLNPELVRRYVIPRARRITEMVAPGKYIVFFQTGRIRAVVPDLVSCRPHGIQHFDVLGDCDLAEIKQSFGRDICIIGNLSPVVIAHGSVDAARAEARRCLSAAKEGGAFIMSTSDEVPYDARLENLNAIVETVSAEGRY